jgi:hydrogenase maturation protease
MSMSRSDIPAQSALVIGLGNPLMGDDGLGLAALARLREAWEVPAEVELVDGGTWGMNLLPIIEAAQAVLLIDAINLDAAPGTLVMIPRSQLPRRLAMKMSPHQVGMCDVLALAELRGTLPERAAAVGLQPETIALTIGLSDVLRRRLDDVVESAVRLLYAWGHPCMPMQAAGASHSSGSLSS